MFTSRPMLETIYATSFSNSGLSGVRSMCHTFSSCAFTTILADSTWALPTSGISGMQCFYNCKKLVGGNGTAWSSSNTNYTYMLIDRTGQAGYLTAA